MMERRIAWIVRALVAAWAIFAAGGAQAQSYSAEGAVGYLGEWEMKGSLAKTATGAGAGYAGPVTLRHVGLCSVNGVEEKAGTLELKMSSRKSDIEGTLVLPDDKCRVTASASQGYTGLLSCRDGQGIPIKFSIEQMRDTGHSASVEGARAQ
jgi:hypothetical protein